MKEKKQRQTGLRVVMEIGNGVHKRKIDTEDFHENDEEGIALFLKARIEEIERQMENGDQVTGTDGSPTAPLGKVKGSQTCRLNRLTHYKNKQGDVTSSLSWEDLTGMKLDAGKVVEARAKEVTYLREKRVYDKVPRQQALRRKWKIIKTRWIDINKGTMRALSIGADS